MDLIMVDCIDNKQLRLNIAFENKYLKSFMNKFEKKNGLSILLKKIQIRVWVTTG